MSLYLRSPNDSESEWTTAPSKRRWMLSVAAAFIMGAIVTASWTSGAKHISGYLAASSGVLSGLALAPLAKNPRYVVCYIL